MNLYTQSGIITPQYSNADSRLPQYRQDPNRQDTDPGEQPGGGTAEAPGCTGQGAAVASGRKHASAFDYAFFFAREYWWAVAIAAFLLGMWYKKKGA